MANPNIGITFNAKGFNSEVRSMTDELKKTQQEFKLADEQIKRTGSALDQTKNKVSYLKKELDQQSAVTKKYEEGIEKVSTALDNSKKKLDEEKAAYEKARKEKKLNEEELQKLYKEVEKAEKAVESNTKKLNNFEKSLNNSKLSEEKLKTALSTTNEELKKQESLSGRVKSEMDKMSQKTAGVAQSLNTAGNALTKGVTVPVVAAGAAMVKAMDAVDEGLDTIMQKTGATGDAAKELDGIYREVASTVPGEFGDIGAAVGELNTRLDFTGDKLKTSSVAFLEFARVNGTDVNQSVQLVTRAMGDAGIQADDYQGVLDMLTVAAQKSGISIENLTTNLAKYGAPMRALGFDTKQSIALFSAWEKAGVNTEIAFSGLKKAISNWGKEGKDSRVEFSKTLDEIKKCPDIAAATSKAIEVFGAKAGPDLADAIKGGRFEFEKYIEALENSGGAVHNTYGMITDEVDDAKLALQNAQLAVHDAGETIAKTLGPILLDCANWLKGVTEGFASLDQGTQKTILAIAALAAGIGPLLKMSSGVVSAGSKIAGLVKGLGGFAKAAGTAGSTTATMGASISSVAGAAGSVLGPLALAGGAVFAIGKFAEKTTDAYYNMGDSVEEAGNNFDEARNKTKLTKDNIKEWEDLSGKIADAKTPADELAAAQQRRKDLEQWFIDHYGDFVTAEDIKNGALKEGLDIIKERNDILEGQERQKLEIEVSKNVSKIPDLQEDVNKRKQNNKILGEELRIAESNQLAIQNEYNKLFLFLQQDHTEEEIARKTEEVKKSVSAMLQPEAANAFLDNPLSGLQKSAELYGLTITGLNRQIEENNQRIKDGTDSINAQTDGIKKLVEADLGGTIEESTASYEHLLKAQKEYNETGKISQDTLNKLIEKFPELKDAAENPKLISDAVSEMNGKFSKAFENIEKYSVNGKEDIKVLKGAFDELNRTGSISEDTMKKVVDIIPGFENVKDKPRALIDAIWELARAADNALGKIRILLTTGNTQAAVDAAKELAGLKAPIPKNAKGTKNAYEGPAIVNEEGPELIVGRDKTARIIPTNGATMTYLEAGDTVYTAQETKGFFRGKKIPGFASGKTPCQQAKEDFDYRKQTSEVSLGEELAWWQDVLSRYADDAEAVKQANIEIYKLNKSLADKEKSDRKEEYEERKELSDEWLERKTEEGDYGAVLDGLKRVKDYTYEYYQAGILSAKEYAKAIKDVNDQISETEALVLEDKSELSRKYVARIAFSGDMQGDNWEDIFRRFGERDPENLSEFKQYTYDELNDNSERWLEDEKFYGRLSHEEELAGRKRQLTRVKQFAAEATTDEEREKYYEEQRRIEKEIYTLEKDHIEELLDKRLEAAQKEYDAQRKAIEDKYAAIDRAETEQERREEEGDIRSQMALYEGAVTIEGRKRYEQLQKELKQLDKEREKEQRELEKNAELEKLDAEWEAYQETQQKSLELMTQSLAATGETMMDITNTTAQMIDGILARVKAMETSVGQAANAGTGGSVTNTYNQTNYQTINSAGVANAYGRMNVGWFKLGVGGF